MSQNIVTSSPDSARAAAAASERERARIANIPGETERLRRGAAARAKKEAEAQKAAAKAAAALKKKVKTDSNDKKPPTEPLNYRWNLPPHKWSLPVRAVDMHPDLYTDSLNPTLGTVDERYRRGRIWWYANTKNTYASNVKGNPKNQSDGEDRKYGFQFLWNPETFSTSVSLNTEVTPTPADRFVGVAGAFPSGETISFTIRVDRTNDFACFRNLLKKDYGNSLNLVSPVVLNVPSFPINDAGNAARLAAEAAARAAGSAQSAPTFDQLASYYNSSFSLASGEKMSKKIKDLLELGTLADIEYIYKAVNGPNWKSISGRETSDIGYLSATLLRVDVGPASYIGYINSLTVNHLAFSQDMTPFRTDVQISMNLMASAGIATDGTAAAVAPTK
jgi:hypothetical protein